MLRRWSLKWGRRCWWWPDQPRVTSSGGLRSRRRRCRCHRNLRLVLGSVTMALIAHLTRVLACFRPHVVTPWARRSAYLLAKWAAFAPAPTLRVHYVSRPGIAPLLASSSGISPSLHFARVDLAPLGHACYDIEKKGLLCDLICAKSATDRHAHTSTLIHIHTHIRRRAYKHEHKHNHARATD